MDIKKAREDLFVMLFFAVFCVFLLAYVIPHEIPVPAVAANQVFTPQTFPAFLSYGLALCTAIGLVKAIIEYVKIANEMREKGIKEEHKKLSREELLGILIPYIVYVVVVIYGLLFKYIGFVWAAVIVPPVILFLVKDRKWQHYLIIYAFIAAMYALFKLVLHVPIR